MGFALLLLVYSSTRKCPEGVGKLGYSCVPFSSTQVPEWEVLVRGSDALGSVPNNKEQITATLNCVQFDTLVSSSGGVKKNTPTSTNPTIHPSLDTEINRLNATQRHRDSFSFKC